MITYKISRTFSSLLRKHLSHWTHTKELEDEREFATKIQRMFYKTATKETIIKSHTKQAATQHTHTHTKSCSPLYIR